MKCIAMTTNDNKFKSVFETKSMAEILEKQGKYREAFLIYRKLYLTKKSPEIKQALLRIRDALLEESKPDPRIEKLRKILENIHQYTSVKHA